jgi:hypothetical protein
MLIKCTSVKSRIIWVVVVSSTTFINQRHPQIGDPDDSHALTSEVGALFDVWNIVSKCHACECWRWYYWVGIGEVSPAKAQSWIHSTCCDEYCPWILTCPFSTECAVDVVGWGLKRVCRDCNMISDSAAFLPFLGSITWPQYVTVRTQPESRFQITTCAPEPNSSMYRQRAAWNKWYCTYHLL